MPQPLDDLAEGRRLLAEGREAIALEHFTVAADSAASGEDRAAAIAHAAEVNITLGRPYEATAWTERLRGEPARRDQAALLEAVAQLRVGEADVALGLLEQVTGDAPAADGYRASLVHVVRSQILWALDRRDDAVAALVEAVGVDATDPDVWVTLAAHCEHDDVDPSQVLAALPAAGFAETFGHLVHASPVGADRILEALWQLQPGDPRALVLVVYVGSRLTVERALEWSVRLRASGRADDCTLLGLAASPERAALDRVRAAAVAAHTFGDHRAGALLDLAATAVLDGDLPAALQDVGTLAPDLAGDFLVAAASTPSRALVLARALHDGGIADTAVALLRQAIALTGGHRTSLEGAVAQSLSGDDVERLAAVAADGGAGEVAEALRDAA